MGTRAGMRRRRGRLRCGRGRSDGVAVVGAVAAVVARAVEGEVC